MSVLHLVIDDERTLKVPEPSYHARGVDEAIQRIGKAYTDNEEVVLFLDHDLGESEDIRAFVRWLECVVTHDGDLLPTISMIYVHTMNPVGGDWIMRSLDKHFPCRRIAVTSLL